MLWDLESVVDDDDDQKLILKSEQCQKSVVIDCLIIIYLCIQETVSARLRN